MFLNRCYENEAMMNNMGNMNSSNMADMGATSSAIYAGANYNTMSDMMMAGQGCCQNNVCPPVIECPQERVVCRELCYEVPHIIPINTKIINHHIYRHTYQPVYTSTMEDEVSNIYERNCGM